LKINTDLNYWKSFLEDLKTKAEIMIYQFSIFFCGCKQSKSFHIFLMVQRYENIILQNILFSEKSKK